MNGNFKYSLTDEQRNKLKQKLAGKPVKGMVSRAEVCALLQSALDNALNGRAAPPVVEEPETPDCFEQRDFDDFTREEIEQIVTQNRLLISRVNRLQHRLDLELS